MKAEIKALLVLGLNLPNLQGQSIVAPGLNTSPQSAPIPKYLVYRHFLSWINDLDEKATAAQASDPYEFAKPLQSAHLEKSDLDALRREAKALKNDLVNLDTRAKGVVMEYRQRAEAAIKAGAAMPPPPIELKRIQANRTALAIEHMSSLQRSLGPQKAALLDTYVKMEVAPHVSVKAFLHESRPFPRS